MLNYKIEGGNMPVVICYPEAGQTLCTESGSMSWMSPNMKMETNTGGGLKKAFGRLFSGESIFMNEYYAEVVADFLCSNISAYIKGIPQITREASYKTAGHDGVFDVDTPREEEKIEMELQCSNMLLTTDGHIAVRILPDFLN